MSNDQDLDAVIQVTLPRRDYNRLRDLLRRDEETQAIVAWMKTIVFVFASTVISAAGAAIAFWDKVKAFVLGVGGH